MRLVYESINVEKLIDMDFWGAQMQSINCICSTLQLTRQFDSEYITLLCL